MVDYLSQVEILIGSAFPELSFRLTDFANQDGSVDSELLISGLVEDDWQKLFVLGGSFGRIFIQEVLLPLEDFWISTFMLFGTDDLQYMEDLHDRYERYKGMITVGTYYYEITPGSIDKMTRTVVAILEGEKDTHGFIEQRGMKPRAIALRMSWNPLNQNPMNYKK